MQSTFRAETTVDILLSEVIKFSVDVEGISEYELRYYFQNNHVSLERFYHFIYPRMDIKNYDYILKEFLRHYLRSLNYDNIYSIDKLCINNDIKYTMVDEYL